jgi:hypothetical protein
MKNIIIIIVFLLSISLLKAQVVEVEVSLANFTVTATNVSFDILLTAENSTTLYLGNSDFKIDFTSNNFSSPSVAYVNQSNNFTNSSSGAVEAFYIPDVSVIGNSLIFNIQNPGAGSISTFNARAARITGTSKLGRFTLSTISNAAGQAGFAWNCTGTKIFTINPTTFNESQAVVTCASTAALSLPLSLLSFEAKQNEKAVQLNWTTEQEVNTDYFTIERSANGAAFLPIGKVIAQNKASQNSYVFSDATPQLGVNYYRLKMMDKDQTFSYSPIKTVDIQGQLAVSIYPNPTSGHVNIQWQNAENESVHITLQDIFGKVHYTAQQSAAYLDMDMTNLPSGIYFMTIKNKSQSMTHRLLKQ